jgi:hypothetical protein
LAAVTFVLASCHSLSAAPQEGALSGLLGAAQVDQLVAPIALYPDPLVAQILIAATYPLEIVEADRWLQDRANAALEGDALTAALQRQPWDPSVKSLVAFPQVLHTMHKNLEWAEQLGDAFLTQQGDVMDAVQRLRRRAQETGALASTEQQTVSTEDQEITIEPANPDVVYVPIYNPWCIYGPSEYQPFYFGAGTGICMPADDVVAFGAGIYPFEFWGWARFDWRRRAIGVNRERYEQFHAGHERPGEIWHHDSTHRHEVPYRNPQTAVQHHGASSTIPSVNAPPNVVRGFGAAPSIVTPETPAGVERRIGPSAPGAPVPQRALPPAFESFGGGAQVRGEAARGFSSRMSIPAPSFQAAPMPSFHGAPMAGFHGGFGGGRR